MLHAGPNDACVTTRRPHVDGRLGGDGGIDGPAACDKAAWTYDRVVLQMIGCLSCSLVSGGTRRKIEMWKQWPPTILNLCKRRCAPARDRDYKQDRQKQTWPRVRAMWSGFSRAE